MRLLCVRTLPLEQGRRGRPQKECPDDPALHTLSQRLIRCRQQRQLTREQVSRGTGIPLGVYRALELGKACYISGAHTAALAAFFGKPEADFSNAYSRFLDAGQGKQLRALREAQGLTRKAFAEKYGIAPVSLENWETERKVMSRRSWEKYFRDLPEDSI